MKTIDLKVKKVALKGAMIGLAVMMAISLLLTDCSTGKALQSSAGDTQEQVSLSDDCALLHIYRRNSMLGLVVNYSLRLDGEVIFHVKNKSKTTVMVTGEGLKTFSARTEATAELPVDIQLGREYYIRCGISKSLVGCPSLELVDNRKGKKEFDAIRSK
jgi:hypothetical protein